MTAALALLLVGCAEPSGDTGGGDPALDCPTPILWYPDRDGDSFGAGEAVGPLCERPEGHVANADDCDDGDPAISPIADEVCDGVDNDCDELVDPGTAIDARTCYADADGDGFGDADQPTDACACVDGLSDTDDDCDDGNAGVHPGAAEVTFDDVDENCNGDGDEYDGDADGYNAQGYADGTDCDDTDASINPGALDLCDDAIDQDCDGILDECTMTGELDADAAAWLSINRSRVDDLNGTFGHDLAYAGDSNGDGLPEIVALAAEFPDDDGAPVPIAYLLLDIPSGTSGGSLDVAALTIASWPMPDPDTYWTGMHAASDSTIIAGRDLDGDGYSDFLFSTNPTQSDTVFGRLDLSYGPAVGEQDLDAGPTLVYPGNDVEFTMALDLVAPPGGDQAWSVAARLFPQDVEEVEAGGVSYAATVFVSSSDFEGSTDLTDAPVLWTNGYQEQRDSLHVDDFDSDGIADLATPIQYYAMTPTPPGCVLVFKGPFDSDRALDDAELSICGDPGDLDFGISMAAVGDIDGDGLPDLAAMAPAAPDGREVAQLGFYAVGSLDSPRALGLTSDISRVVEDGVYEFTQFNPIDAVDPDGDGRREIAVAVCTTDDGSCDGDAVALYEAPPSGTIATTDADAILVDQEDPGPDMGAGMLSGHDFDGDGLGDLVVGAASWHDGADSIYSPPVGRILIFRGAGAAR